MVSRLWVRRVLAATMPAAFSSLAVGQTLPGHWKNISPPGGIVRVLAIDPQSPSTVYAGLYGGGIFKTVDGGSSWTWASNGLAGRRVFSLAIDPMHILYAGTNNGVFKSTNGGATWSPSGGGLVNSLTQSMAIDPENPETIYAGTNNGIFKSTDGAATWAPASSGIGASTVSALAIDPTSPSTVYAGTNAGVFKSSDGGASWTPATIGITNNLIHSLAIDPRSPSTIYAASGQGLFKTTDGGASWNAVGGQPYQFFGVVVDPQTPSTVYACTFAGVLKSVNGVGRWERNMSGLPQEIVWSVAIDPVTPSNLYVGTQVGLFKSTDAGVSAAAADSGLSPLRVFGLAIDPNAPQTLYAGTDLGLFKSVDGGHSWTLLAEMFPDTSVWTVAVLADSSILVGTDGNGFRSTDGGMTWTQGFPPVPIPYSFAIDPASPSTIYAAGGAGPSLDHLNGAVSRSTDGGSTWNVFGYVRTGTPLPPLFNAAAVNPSPPPPEQGKPSLALLVGSEAGIWGVLVHQGGGIELATSGGLGSHKVFAVAVDPRSASTVYAGTDGGLYESTDGGLDWAQVTNGLTATGIHALLFDPASPSTFYAGTDAGVFVSADRGASWTPMNDGLTSPAVNALARAPGPGGALYAATNGAGVFVFTHESGPCVPSETVLCLSARFQVAAEWQKPDGTSGPGTAVPLTANTGYFWFFDPTNVEIVTKVLDGCAVDNHYWVFSSGLTNVGVRLTYTDRGAGVQKTYTNAVGSAFQPVQDTSAFSTCP